MSPATTTSFADGPVPERATIEFKSLEAAAPTVVERINRVASRSGQTPWYSTLTDGLRDLIKVRSREPKEPKLNFHHTPYGLAGTPCSESVSKNDEVAFTSSGGPYITFDFCIKDKTEFDFLKQKNSLAVIQDYLTARFLRDSQALVRDPTFQAATEFFRGLGKNPQHLPNRWDFDIYISLLNQHLSSLVLSAAEESRRGSPLYNLSDLVGLINGKQKLKNDVWTDLLDKVWSPEVHEFIQVFSNATLYWTEYPDAFFDMFSGLDFRSRQNVAALFYLGFSVVRDNDRKNGVVSSTPVSLNGFHWNTYITLYNEYEIRSVEFGQLYPPSTRINPPVVNNCDHPLFNCNSRPPASNSKDPQNRPAPAIPSEKKKINPDVAIDYLLAFCGVMASEANQRFLWNSNSTLPVFFGDGYFRLSPFGKAKKSLLDLLTLGPRRASVDTETFSQVFKPIEILEYGGKTWVMSRPMKEMFEKMGVFKTPHAEP